MRPFVDTAKCLGYAVCTLDAPSIFEMDEDANVAIVIVEEVAAEDRAQVDEAIKSCPAHAISWDESGTGQER